MILRFLFILFLMAGIALGQTNYNPDYEKYEVLVRSIEMDSTQIEFDGYFKVGDSIGLSFSHEGAMRNDSWLPFDSAKDIVVFITNVPQMWDGSEARVMVPIEIPEGHWQIRLRTVGWSYINWETSRFSDFSDRVDIYVEAGGKLQPAKVYIILQ